MKNTIAILLTLAALNVLAQMQLINLNTQTVNTVSSRGYLTVYQTNIALADVTLQFNASGYATNLVKTFYTNTIAGATYFAFNPNNTNNSESAYSAWTKANANFLLASNQLATLTFTITNYIGHGQTTNFQFTDGNLLNPGTNTLYFYQGALTNSTSP